MTDPTPRRIASTERDPWRDAGRYDGWFDTRWGRYAFNRELQMLSWAVDGGSGTRVVDVGCGTARFTDRVCAAGARVVGLDREPAMLARARGHTSVPLVSADALALPLRDRSVDVALAVAVLEFVSDPVAAMAEMARVVRRGGRIVVGALNPHSSWGLTRRRDLAAPPWNAARFLSGAELRTLGRPHGQVELRSTLYAPGDLPFLGFVGPVLEALGRAVPAWGAFKVLVVHTDQPATSPRPSGDPTGTISGPGSRPRRAH